MKIIRFLVFCLLAVAVPAAMHGETIVLTGALLIDGTGRPPVENSFLVVTDGRIAATGAAGDNYQPPAGARVLDVHGRTIIPGLISAHSHLGLVKGSSAADPANYTRENVSHQLDVYEGLGVTALISLGTNRDVLYTWRDEQRAGKLGGADIFTADRGIGVPGGVPPFPLPGDQVYRPKNVEEARADVREMSARHPDLIKLWLDDMFGKLPKMRPEIYRTAIDEAHAAIDEAHQHGLRVAAHLFYLEDAKALASAGVDVFAHSIRDLPVDAEIIAAMKERKITYIPTLALDESQYVYAEHPAWMQEPVFMISAGPELTETWLGPQYFQKVVTDPLTPRNKAAHVMAMRNVKTLADAGVSLAMGTDSGALPTRLAGWAEHRELQLLVKAGLTPMQAIVSATAGSARVIGQEAERGTLEPGKRADFLVLEANPLEEISSTLRLDTIWHGGKPVVPLTKRPLSE